MGIKIRDLRNHAERIVDPSQLYRANEEFAALLTEAVYADLSALNASGQTGVELCNHVMNAQRDVRLLLRQFERAKPFDPVPSDWVQEVVANMSLGSENLGDELARHFRRAARAIEQEFTRTRGQGDGIASDVGEVCASHTALVAEATRRLAQLLEIDLTDSTHEQDEPATFIHEWAKAIVTNDVTQMASFTSDEWVLVDKPGVINSAIFQGTAIEADEWTTNILVAGDNGWRCVLTQLTPRTGTS